MLVINQSKLRRMELILNQSAKGCHFLFDNKRIAQILKIPTEEREFFQKVNMGHIQQLLIGLLEQKSFHKKQEYLNSLNHRNFEILVRTYFYIVDSTLMDSLTDTH